jgi:hypothetical protein
MQDERRPASEPQIRRPDLKALRRRVPSSYYRVLILVVAAMLVGLAISINFRGHLMRAAAPGFALLVAFVSVAGFQQLAALQPLLADLPRTAERITLRDRLATASAATSFKCRNLRAGVRLAIASLSHKQGV